MRRYLLCLLLLPVAPLAHSQAKPGSFEVYRVDEHGGGLGFFIDQTVSFSHAGSGRWIVERTRRDRHPCGPGAPKTCGDERSHDWIDSGACPKVTEVLRDLAAVQPSGFANPDAPNWMVVNDVSLLKIEGLGQERAPLAGMSVDSRLSVSAYFGPYRAWWDKAEKALAGCWTQTAPLVAGEPAAPRLPEQP